MNRAPHPDIRPPPIVPAETPIVAPDAHPAALRWVRDHMELPHMLTTREIQRIAVELSPVFRARDVLAAALRAAGVAPGVVDRIVAEAEGR